MIVLKRLPEILRRHVLTGTPLSLQFVAILREGEVSRSVTSSRPPLYDVFVPSPVVDRRLQQVLEERTIVHHRLP